MAEFIADEAEFNTRLAEANILVVYCTAPWCGPCKLVTPSIDRLSAEYGDRAQIFKLDIEVNRPFAKQLGLRNIPVVLYFKAGEKVQAVLGVKDYAEYNLALTNLLE
ncbi:thioredoxin family protein [Chamaesiphon sp. OTE_8_metabat_110]|uniref:thioredoxin family protein n=1 Tax=Chamaesiphon sp. OTE_8_metabat_110 TaxID=2964696 RepID=UPI00286C466D|nr:thioredoxin family protein [Chamaesiphon sp. OTE_8_metabat_110]